ncbi:MAG: Rnase Y domain-containing protein, partial [Nitrospinota bacterium]
MAENSPLFLACVAAAGVVAGYVITLFFNKNKANESERRASQILEDGEKKLKQRSKELELEAKEDRLKRRNEIEKEMEERRNEVQRSEKSLNNRVENLERRTGGLDGRERDLNRKESELNKMQGDLKKSELELEELIETERRELEKVSGMTAGQAKDELKEKLTNETRLECAGLVNKIEEEAREKAKEKAVYIISLAVQRCSPDYVAETTVSVVDLPSDDMKGRIIGREGRNIRALEVATGVDLIVDDTPEAVTISCYDPIKRITAKMAIERLINDGRIHPARIEEIVEKVKKDLNNTIKSEGEKAAFEVGVDGLKPEIIKLLGRLKYRTSYSQNVLRHSIEVAFLAGMMAAELGLDQKVAKRA